jgi:hypothetical protein
VKEGYYSYREISLAKTGINMTTSNNIGARTVS